VENKDYMLIDGKQVAIEGEKNVLEMVHKAGIELPTFCYHPELSIFGACRMCVVETSRGAMEASCSAVPKAGMEIYTNTPRLRKYRRVILELLLSNHCRDCTACQKNGHCKLQDYAMQYGVRNFRFQNLRTAYEIDDSSPAIIKDQSKCILCGECVRMCNEVQTVGAIDLSNRSAKASVSTFFDEPLAESGCIACGQCTVVCPTGALVERDDTDEVWAALADPTKHVVVGPAPSVRATLGECFDYEIGTNVEGKMVAALRKLGFDKVFDVDTAADFTIMEEGTEFLNRLKEGGTLPLLTSCSPGWINFVEQYYPDMLDNVSSCRSPQGMFGSLVKSYYAEKAGIDPKDIVVVSIMPCTAKKYECKREEMRLANGVMPVDISITTRELGRMIEQAGIDFKNLAEEEFDPMLGISTGASVIFGATGGVMEAALRTVVEIVTGKTLENVEFKEVRGMDGIKEASYELPGKTVRVAAVSGLGNTRKVLEGIKSGELNYDFVEVMCCPGGCINGGGQPYQPTALEYRTRREDRAEGLYGQDANMPMRKSHENPIVDTVYKEYLGEIGGHKAHELLHTHYIARPRYQ
jgi:NADP-reducing hydrogenase subunit HndD